MKNKPKVKVERLIVIFVAVLFLALGVYLFFLDQTIHSKFEAHRWNLPSRVYSDATILYPGAPISIEKIERKLERLTYKKVPQAFRTGEFARSGKTVTVYLRDFVYPSENFSGIPLEMTFEDGTLRTLKRLDTKDSVKTMRLEPELIASIFDDKMEDRTIVTLDKIPEELIKAVIAVEDERFYQHHGIDPIAITRALVTDILHLRAKQGGSTLTQQLVKNFFLTSEKTLTRKINEMFMAVILDLRYSKEEILEAYFNEIYFGQRGSVSVTGVEEASKLYFGKSVSHINLAEAALLAGLIRAPGQYSPFHHLERAYDRRNLVLKQMLVRKSISQKSYEEARREKIVLPRLPEKIFGAPYFIDFVQNELKENYPADILQSEGLRIFTTLDLEAQETAERIVLSRLKTIEESRSQLKKLADQGKHLEGALIALQPQTGAIRVFVGGRSFATSQFDRIRSAHRQPGSAFKPFVYAAALETGETDAEEKWTLSSMIADTSFSVTSGGKNWSPDNYDKKEHGEVTLREALEHSYNIAATRLAIDVGLEKVVALARSAGIRSPLEPYPSLALGAFEVTPLELLRAYTIFPNQGSRSEPIAITHVMTREGKVLEKKGFKMKKVISPELAYLMNKALQGVVLRGTASSASSYGFKGLAAGKTGTTSDYRDSWFVGYTPDLLALSWVGFDDQTPTGLSGASGALPIWAEFMAKVNPPGAHREDFPGTENIYLVKVDKFGRLYEEDCGEPFEEAFLKGTEPTESCEN